MLDLILVRFRVKKNGWVAGKEGFCGGELITEEKDDVPPGIGTVTAQQKKWGTFPQTCQKNREGSLIPTEEG